MPQRSWAGGGRIVTINVVDASLQRQAGRFAELWEPVTTDHARRTMTQQKHDDDQLLREARRVASLVDQGMLSRAASQLCSRGIAQDTPEALFPDGALPLHCAGMETPAFELRRQ